MSKMRYFMFSILLCGFANLRAVDYATEIQPIFNDHCTNCHNSSHFTGLDLTSYASVMSGSNNGPVITAGNHSSSLLWQKINDEEMPPSGDGLSPSNKNSIAEWIDSGAILEIFFSSYCKSISN